MGNTNGVIKKPARTKEDIAYVLGVGIYKLGYLCGNRHGKTNKWAKYKPVRYEKYSEMNYNDRKSVNFGLRFPSGNPDATIAVTQDYIYDAPRGIAYKELFRSLDFNGYNHSAYSPSVNRNGTKTWNTLLQEPLVFEFVYYTGLPDSISIDEVNPILLTCFSAIAISYKRNNTQYVVYKTAEKNIKDDTTKQIMWTKDELPFTYDSNQISELKYYMLACNNQKTTVGAEDPSHMFYSLPFALVSDGQNNINMVSDLMMTFTSYGVSTSPTASPSAISNFTSSNRFQLLSTGGFWIAWNVTNKRDVSSSITGSLFTGNEMPSPTGGYRDQTGHIAMTVYDITDGTLGSPITGRIDIGAGQTRKLLIGQVNWLKYKDGALQTNIVSGNYDAVSYMLYNAQYSFQSGIVYTKF